MHQHCYTNKIKDATRFSIKTHEVYQKQKRKGKDIAYITHPLTVGVILARAGASEDVVAAGILHDTIEDSIPARKVTPAMLADRFGANVARLVVSVTNSPNGRANPEEKHRLQIERVAAYPHDSVLVKSADVISNVFETIDDYARDGDAVFDRFALPKDRMLAHWLVMIDALLARWKESPLSGDLARAARELRVLR